MKQQYTNMIGLCILLVAVITPTSLYAETVDAEIDAFVGQDAFQQVAEFVTLTKPGVLPVNPSDEFINRLNFGTAAALLFETGVQIDVDPILNIRLEIFNPSEMSQGFGFQIKIPTEVTSGPTFNNTFANFELFDDNEDGFASVQGMNTFFEVIDDPQNGMAINGAANLGERFSFTTFTEGKVNLFDNIGVGPNSDDFMGDGFNFLRFSIGGFVLSPGDRAVITAMGCYGNDSEYCPERYEIPATVVPLPAAVWLMGVGLISLVAVSRRKT